VGRRSLVLNVPHTFCNFYQTARVLVGATAVNCRV
jgi:hypothetical protein